MTLPIIKDLYVVILAMLVFPVPMKYADRTSAAQQIPSMQAPNISVIAEPVIMVITVERYDRYR